MDKETVKRLADECGLVKSIISPAYMLATDAQLLAFAQACCDWQKEEDAQICEYRNRTHASNGQLFYAANAIRNAKESPESDIDQATRKT